MCLRWAEFATAGQHKLNYTVPATIMADIITGIGTNFAKEKKWNLRDGDPEVFFYNKEHPVAAPLMTVTLANDELSTPSESVTVNLNHTTIIIRQLEQTHKS